MVCEESSQCSYYFDKVTRNNEPLLSLLAVITPLCAVTTFLHKANPMPLPPDEVLVLELTVNGLKISNNSSFGIPKPPPPPPNFLSTWLLALKGDKGQQIFFYIL